MTMEKMKERILEVLKKEKKYTLRRKDIEQKAGIQKSSEYALFSKAMDELENEFFIVRSARNMYATAEQAGMITAVIRINKNRTGYITVDDESVKIFKEDLLDAMNGDTVRVMLSKDQKSAKVLTVLKRAVTHLVGTFVQRGRGLKWFPDDELYQNVLMTVQIPRDFHPVAGMKTYMAIERYGEPMKVSLEKVIGYINDPGVDILGKLLSHEIDPVFPEEVLKEADEVYHPVEDNEKTGRTDLTKEITFTIDGEDSKDFDDAVSVKKTESGWNLEVSIADVSWYVKEGSAIDQEAFKRGTSVYVVDKVVPMLPQILSNGICSLNPEEERLTMTCDMDIDTQGNILSYTVYPSWIISCARMTYQKVNAFFEGELREHVCQEDLLVLRDCARAIRKQRNERGALDFSSTESKITVNDQGYPVKVEPEVRGEAEMMIEDCMIAANVCVADLLQKEDIPGIYRVHEEPEMRKLKEFANAAAPFEHALRIAGKSSLNTELQAYLASLKDTKEEYILSQMLLRCMQKARYEDSCLGHFGLAEESYLHFTSPIRRYPDLVVHRMIRRYYFNHQKNRGTDREKMKDIAVQSSLRERVSMEAERDVEDMKKAEYMMSKVGTVLEGIIVSVLNFGFYVQFPDTIEGLVKVENLKDDYYVYDGTYHRLYGERHGKKYTLGDRIKVKVIQAVKETGTIDLEPYVKEVKKKQVPVRNDRKERKGGRQRGTKTRERKNRRQK